MQPPFLVMPDHMAPTAIVKDSKSKQIHFIEEGSYISFAAKTRDKLNINYKNCSIIFDYHHFSCHVKVKSRLASYKWWRTPGYLAKTIA